MPGAVRSSGRMQFGIISDNKVAYSSLTMPGAAHKSNMLHSGMYGHMYNINMMVKFFIFKIAIYHTDNGMIYYRNHENWEWMKPSKGVGSSHRRK